MCGRVRVVATIAWHVTKVKVDRVSILFYVFFAAAAAAATTYSDVTMWLAQVENNGVHLCVHSVCINFEQIQ